MKDSITSAQWNAVRMLPWALFALGMAWILISLYFRKSGNDAGFVAVFVSFPLIQLVELMRRLDARISKLESKAGDGESN